MDEKKINDSGIEMNVCATHDNRSSSLIEEDEDEKYILEEKQRLVLNMAQYKGAATEATRAMNIMKRRERAAEELEIKKRKLEDDLKLSKIVDKFATKNETIKVQLKQPSVGLVTLDQLRERNELAAKEREKELARSGQECAEELLKRDKLSGEKKLPVNSKSLSFGWDDDEDEEEEEEDDDDDDEGDESRQNNEKVDCCDNLKIDEMVNKRNKRKNIDVNITIEGTEQDSHTSELPSTLVDPDDRSNCNVKKPQSRLGKLSNIDVDTSLLPDREREQEERRYREKLAEEWREQQQRLKEEEIEITFSYWDGSGHRRQVKMKKGDSIYQFLQACLENLRKDFNELRKVSADQLMYVKEDLIIPQHYTFYDFIVTKARGKSGPLFSFDVHDDIRLMGDSRVEKDESHAGKVLLRNWYERNKHIFPASRWEPYDPSKSYDKYTIGDRKAK